MIALRYSQPTLWNDQPMILEGWRKGIWGVWMNQSLNSSNANGLTIKVQSNFWWSPFLWLALPPRDFTKASQKRNPRRICQNFHSTLKSTAIEDKSDCISKTEKQDTLTLFRQDREFVLKNRIFSIDRSREYTYFCLSSPAHFIFFPTEYCSLPKRWKEQPRKMWDCVCGWSWPPLPILRTATPQPGRGRGGRYLRKPGHHHHHHHHHHQHHHTFEAKCYWFTLNCQLHFGLGPLSTLMMTWQGFIKNGTNVRTEPTTHIVCAAVSLSLGTWQTIAVAHVPQKSQH